MHFNAGQVLDGADMQQAAADLLDLLIAVASGAAMLGVGAATRDRTAESAAQRLARTLDLAVDEATISDSAVLLTWTADGYAFAPSGQGLSLPAPLAAAQRLRAGLRLTAEGGSDGGVADGFLGGRSEGRLAITSAATGPAVVFRIEGAGPAQRVIFDGFTATYAGTQAQGATP